MIEKKVLLITGASTGIGKACADFLGMNGYRVYGTSRRANPEPVDCGACRMLQMDVADSASVARGIAAIVEAEGRIDAVFNNAGIHTTGPIEALSLEGIEATFQTNCFGAIRVCKEVIPLMRAQKSGRIINMTSIAGIIAAPYQGAYCGSKFALEGMTESLRHEVRRFGIKVSLIEPGDIRHQDCSASAASAEAYEPYCSNALHVGWADEEKGYPPEKIGPLVARILGSPNPRLRYIFGPAYQSAAVALKRRLLPDRLGCWAIGKYYRT
jgi:NAD(P)-dependent dehydrogenase (short-subunit alcohol dehydrogenase family)